MGFNQQNGDFNGMYPLVNKQFGKFNHILESLSWIYGYYMVNILLIYGKQTVCY